MRLFGFQIRKTPTDGGEQRSLENPAIPLSDPRATALFFGEGLTSAAGVNVSIEAAMGVPAVWAAVNFLADTVAALPLKLFKRTAEGAQPAAGDPLHRILHDAVNPEVTSFRWRKLMMVAILTSGRGLSFIERAPSGRVLNLWPLDPSTVTVERVAGRLRYKVETGQMGGAGTVYYGADEVIDIAFMPTLDGVGHRDPIHTLRNALGLAIALEAYASRFFQAGGVPPMQLVGPFTTPEGAGRAAMDVADAIKRARQGGRNVLPLPLGHELKAIGFDPSKGQLTDARRMQIEEIARIYGLPPVFLQDLTRATFSNVEQQALALVKHTLGQWVRAWEQELNLKLFGQQRTRFVEFSLDGLLRGDFATRMSGYAQAIQNGIRSPDECRALESLPPRGGPADRLHIQGATVPLGSQPVQPASADAQDAGDPPPEDDQDED